MTEAYIKLLTRLHINSWEKMWDKTFSVQASYKTNWRLTTTRQTTFFILHLHKSFITMEPLTLLSLHLDEMLILNLLHPNISLQILHTVLYTFPGVLTRWTSFTCKSCLVGDHFLYSPDLNVWFRDDIIRRNMMLVTLGVKGFKPLTTRLRAFGCTRECWRSSWTLWFPWHLFIQELTLTLKLCEFIVKL